MRTALGAFTLIFVTLLAGAAVDTQPVAVTPIAMPEPAIVTPVIPACEEDELLTGYGSFDAGHWSAYRCGPVADDIIVVLP